MSPLAILTGASSGIGAAAAEQFIDQGYSVVNISRRDCPVPGVETLHTDLADAASLTDTCDTLAARLQARKDARTCLLGAQRLVDAQRPLRYHRGLSTDGSHLG